MCTGGRWRAGASRRSLKREVRQKTSTRPRQVGRPDAEPQQILRAAKAARGIDQSLTKLAEIIRGSVGEFVIGLSPDVLGWVEFQGIGREVVHAESRMIDEEGPDLSPTIDRPAIPEQVDRTAKVAHEVTQEGLDIEPREIVGPTAEVKCHAPPPWRHRQATADRQAIVAVPVTDAWGSAVRRPGAADVRDQKEAALIDEHEMGATSSGIFIRGHSSRFHRAIAASSR